MIEVPIPYFTRRANEGASLRHTACVGPYRGRRRLRLFVRAWRMNKTGQHKKRGAEIGLLWGQGSGGNIFGRGWAGRQQAFCIQSTSPGATAVTM